MNWGTKLVTAMALFMVFIIGLSMKMIFSEKDDLVDKNYYEKGLNYDHDYQRKQNVLNDKAEPLITLSPGQLQVLFSKPVKGTLRLSHPSDNNKDKAFKIELKDNEPLVLPLDELNGKGQWRLSAEWESEGRQYLFEKYVFIP